MFGHRSHLRAHNVFGRATPARNVFGRATPARNVFGRATPARNVFGRATPARNVRLAAAVVVTAVVVLSSCSTVINNTANTEAPDDTVAVATSTTIPSGDITSLLNQLVASANGLGEAIATRQNDQARQQSSDVLAIWTALQPQLLDSGIDVVEDLDRMVRLVQTAVERKRPADADKAFRFISIIAKEIPALL